MPGGRPSGPPGCSGCRAEQILVASTGIIGHQLPMPKLEAGLGDAVAALSREPSGFLDAARAIMTTDTRPKIVSERRDLSGKDVTLLGLAKGAAMIGPRMATMLAFLLTDAPVRAYDLRGLLADAVDSSFNCLSVEGHASTNDTVLLISSTAATEETLRGEDVGGVRRDGPRGLRVAGPPDRRRRRGFHPLHHDRCRGMPDDRGCAGHRPRRGREPAGQDRDPWRRPQLGPDRLGRRVRRSPVPGGGGLALDQRGPRLSSGCPRAVRRGGAVRIDPGPPAGRPAPDGSIRASSAPDSGHAT